MSAPSPPRFDESGIRPFCSDQALEFYWGAPASADQTGYTLSCPTDPSSPYAFAANIGYTKITGLTNGQEYAYQITADNGNGSSAPAFYTSVEPGLIPGVPLSTSVIFLNISTAKVSFTPAASNGGASIKWYVANALSTDPADPVVSYDCRGIDSNIYITGLNPVSYYTFMTYAVNDPGYSLGVSYSPIIQSGLLVYLDATQYSGSGTWYDQSPNNNNATLEDGTIAKNAAGNGIVLNGSTSWTFPDVGSLSNWTLSVWFKNTATPQNFAAIVTQINGGSANMWIRAFPGSPAYSYRGGFYDGVNTYEGSNAVLALNVWKQMVVTWNGTTLTTYINSSVDSAPTYSGVTSVSCGLAYRIGRRWDAANYVTGEIGQVLIYNRALSVEEISYNYNLLLPIYS